jgi:hypothetical protein
MSSEELDRITADVRARQNQVPQEVNVCIAAGCLSLHSDVLKDALEKQTVSAGIPCGVSDAWGFARRAPWSLSSRMRGCIKT